MSAKKKSPPKQKSSQKGNFPLEPPFMPRQGGMRFIAVKTLREFWESHADAEQPQRLVHQELALKNLYGISIG